MAVRIEDILDMGSGKITIKRNKIDQNKSEELKPEKTNIYADELSKLFNVGCLKAKQIVINTNNWIKRRLLCNT
jgi:hypothetical protein